MIWICFSLSEDTDRLHKSSAANMISRNGASCCVSTRSLHLQRVAGYSTRISRSPSVSPTRKKVSRETPDEDYYVYRALLWISKVKPRITIHCENASLVGCHFLPGRAVQAVDNSLVKIQLTEEAYERTAAKDAPPLALVALSLHKGTETKSFRQLRGISFGASKVSGSDVILCCGMSGSGKTTLCHVMTNARLGNERHLSSLPKAMQQRTLGMMRGVLRCNGDNEIKLMDSPGLRPRLKSLDDHAYSLLVSSNVIPTDDDSERVNNLQGPVLNSILGALNRHAEISTEAPKYVEMLGLDEMTTDTQVFFNAIQNSNRNVRSVIDVVRRANNGHFGGMIFEGGGKTHVDFPMPLESRFDRNCSVLYMNSEAKRLCAIGLDRIEVVPASLPQDTNDFVAEGEPVMSTPVRRRIPTEALPGKRIMFPKHRSSFTCMKCAGFIRERDGQISGTSFDRVHSWKVWDTLCFFSRMADAFGGLQSTQIQYLFKDSLLRTLAKKHKLKTRAQVYKKLPIIHQYPIADKERPLRFRIDQPIQLPLTCKRIRKKNSCVKFDDFEDERHPRHSQRNENVILGREQF